MSLVHVFTWWLGDAIIVKTKDDATGKYKFYAGKRMGVSKEYDVQYIIDWGHQFNPKEIK